MGISISVIVPIFNAEKYLTRCVESIRAQTFHDLEMILVDDGSTDYSGQICDRYVREDVRIKVIHKQNGGLVSARQAGIRVSEGKYIAFVDADDWIEQDMYQSLYRRAEENHADFVLEGMLEDVGGKVKEIMNLLPDGIYASDEEKGSICHNMLSCEDFFCMGILPYLWNKLFKRELVLSHMLSINSDIRVGEDAVAVYPMLAMARKLVISSNCHYHYCIRGDSMTGWLGALESEYKNVMAVKKALKETFQRIGIASIMNKQLERYTANNILTRAYGRVVAQESSSMLPPFEGIRQGDSIIIYGAGAFGKALWSYISRGETVHLKAWLDTDAAKYRKLGLPVKELNETDIDPEDVIVIAVLREKSKEAIQKELIDYGAEEGQIKWIDNSLIPIISYMQ